MRRKLIGVLWLGVALVWVAVPPRTVQATPASGFVSTTLSLGRFDAFETSSIALPDNLWGHWRKKVWLSLQKTQGSSDLYVQSNVW